MFASYSFIVLAGGLLLATVAEAAAPGVPEAPAGVRRIDLREKQGPIPEIHIGPGLATTLLFDSTIRPEEVVLEGRERFQRLGLSEDHLLLVPSSTFRQGEHLLLEVRFRDGATPERVAFLLVVDAARVERQVELYRQPRTAESYRQEVEELKSGMERLRQELVKLQPVNAPAGNRGSLFTIIEQLPEIQASMLSYAREDISAPVSVQKLQSLRVRGSWMVLRLKLSSIKNGEWTAAGAAIQNSQGQAMKVLHPWQKGPVAPSSFQDVVIAMEGAEELPAGRYTLKLWDESGTRTVTLEGLDVP